MGEWDGLGPVFSKNAAEKGAAESLTKAEPNAPKSPAAEMGALAEETLSGSPGVSFEGSAPARLAEEFRITHAASWRVTGNWLLLFLFVIIVVTAGLEYRNTDADLRLGTVVSGIVLIWIVSQIMRLIMIMGYGTVKLHVGGAGEKPGEEKPDEPDEKKPGEEKPAVVV